jgi:CMP-2-keto-3-deoxyoctulosonic acid synthetase
VVAIVADLDGRIMRAMRYVHVYAVLKMDKYNRGRDRVGEMMSNSVLTGPD